MLGPWWCQSEAPRCHGTTRSGFPLGVISSLTASCTSHVVHSAIYQSAILSSRVQPPPFSCFCPPRPTGRPAPYHQSYPGSSAPPWPRIGGHLTAQSSLSSTCRPYTCWTLIIPNVQLAPLQMAEVVKPNQLVQLNRHIIVQKCDKITNLNCFEPQRFTCMIVYSYIIKMFGSKNKALKKIKQSQIL